MSYAIIENEDAYNRAIVERIKANSRKTNQGVWIKIADHAELIAFLEKHDSNEFYKKLLAHYEDYLKLSDGQCEAIRKGIAKRAAQIAERAANSTSDFVGIVGKRAALSLTIDRVMEFEGVYGKTFIYLMSDASGNRIVYKGSKEFVSTRIERVIGHFLGMAENPDHVEGVDYDRYVRLQGPTYRDIQIDTPLIAGDMVKITASVKEHAIRDGIKQTVIARPKQEA